MITYRDVEGSFGFSVAYPWVNANPDAWDVLAQILPLTRPED